MIISLIKIYPQSSKRREVRDLLHYILEPTRVNPECLDCSVYENESDKSILFLEKWQCREALYAHIRSSSYMSVLMAMELSSTVPEVRVIEAEESEGMELIRAVRSV